MRRHLALSLIAVLLLGSATAAYAATRSLNATANLKTTKRDGLRATQTGSVDAKPFGKGTLTLKTFIQKGRVTASFTAKIGGSTVRGTANGKVEVKDKIRYDGTAKITGGTGRFKNARASGLKFKASGPLNGRTSRVTLRGRVTY